MISFTSWNVGHLSQQQAEQVAVGDVLCFENENFVVSKIVPAATGCSFLMKSPTGRIVCTSYLICEPALLSWFVRRDGNDSTWIQSITKPDGFAFHSYVTRFPPSLTS